MSPSFRAIACLLAAAGGTTLGAASQPDDAHAEPRQTETGAREFNTGPIGRMIAAARDGDVIQVPPGVYREHLRIDRSVILDGGGSAIIDGGGSGDIVEISAPGVTFRGFTIRNSGIDLDQENAAIRALAPRATIEHNRLEDVLFGIDLRGAPGSVLRANVIGGKKLDIARRGDGLRLWRSDDSLIENNLIHDGRDAILWYSRGVVVRGNTARDCRYGLHLMFSDSVTVTDNEFRNNSVGVYLMYSTGVEIARNRLVRNRGPSGYGLGLKETDRFRVRHNVILGNRVGVYLDGSPFTSAAPGEFQQNTLAYNDVGMTFLPSARGNEITENNFIDNFDQISVSGRGSLKENSFWKGERGNYWSDYTGYDLNRDGIGDFVHESQTLFENLLDRRPALRLFLFSPAQQAIEFVGRAIPAIRPEAKFTDEVPLMRPVDVDAAPTHPAPRAVMAGSAAGLLGLGAGIVAWAGWPPPRGTSRGRTARGGTP